VPEPAFESVRQNLLRTGLFTFAERDAIAKGALIPNDPSYPSEWHLPIISGPSRLGYYHWGGFHYNRHRSIQGWTRPIRM